MKHLGPDAPVAYFCAEFGVHETLRIYSGGLGILAGDHLKSASDLGVPLVAIGLFYRGGFFIQQIGKAGEQEAVEQDNDPDELGLEAVVDAQGERIVVRIELPSGTIACVAWRVHVGGVHLYLLDTDCEPNDAATRMITRRLYVSAPEQRILQEIVLGIGGELLLHALGITPRVFHLNEGHAAFVSLARVARLHARGVEFGKARSEVAATTVFTTHTPVPAGHDRFSLALVEQHFGHAPQWLGISFEQLVGLAQPAGADGDFNLTYLALRFAGFVNGVSQRHASVSRELLRPAYKSAEATIPITGITNGVHLPTWTNDSVLELLGVGPHERIQAHHFANRVDLVSSPALWRVRRAGRARMVAWLRTLGLVSERDAAAEDALWIGFARRFATYKRATLLFHDLERLAALLAASDRPLRIVFAGKAHPADGHGQQLIREVLAICREPRFAGRVVFVPNYEIDVARRLLEGADVWLNNPRRGEEASGTSGMKAAANGALNVSIADGWWLEGAQPCNGWTIGDIAPHADPDAQDAADALALLELLEREVLPAFWTRDEQGVPSEWIARMRASMRTIPVTFDSDRMVREYLVQAYEALAAGASKLH